MGATPRFDVSVVNALSCRDPFGVPPKSVGPPEPMIRQINPIAGMVISAAKYRA